MLEQTKDDHSSEDQLPGETQPTPSDQLPIKTPPTRLFKRCLQFAIGFLGWFTVNGLLWGAVSLIGSTSNRIPGFLSVVPILLWCFSFPLNIAAFIVLLVFKRSRLIAWGILTAVALNILVSLILSAFQNAMCFAPFFIDAEKILNQILSGL